jgi:hypothetical protein
MLPQAAEWILAMTVQKQLAQRQSFRGAKRTRNLEIPGSMLRIAPE